jgi:alkylation response protein AidB-like acyl-CoA dehydrogenase
MNNRTYIKGGEFLIKDTPAEDMFIPEDFTEEQMMMANASEDFIDREVWPNKLRFEAHDYDFTFELMKKLGEMGLLGISVPEQYGGLGMGFNTYMLIADRVSGASGSLSTAFGAHTGIGTMPILLYGTEEQKQKYLPGLASGELIGCYCLTEPGAGSDANSGRTKAELTEDGKHYKINGQKMWISNAGYADVFIVFARIEDDKNITGFIIDKGTEGLTLGEEEHKMGINASSTRQVFFNDVTIPVENLLGERNGGFKIAMNALNYGRIKLAVATLDANKRSLNESIKYANERKQFGVNIGRFGAIKHKLGEMATKHYASESAVYRYGQLIEDNIARLEAEGMSPQEAKLKGVEEYAIECALLKVYGSESNSEIIDEAVQIFGGMGYSAESAVESAYRDCRITRIYEGTNEINRMLSIGMLLKKAMKGEMDLMTPAMAVANDLMAIPSFDTPDYSAHLAQEVELVGKMKKAVLMVAGKAVEALGMDIEKHQEILMQVSDMLTAVMTAESVVLRTLKLGKKKGEENVAYQTKMAQLHVHNAVEHLGKAGREAIYAFAEGDDQRLLMMGLKRFTKYNQPVNPMRLRRDIAVALLESNKYGF